MRSDYDWRSGVRDQVYELVSDRIATHEFRRGGKNNTFQRERCSIVDSVSPLIDCASRESVLCSLNIGISCKELGMDPGRKSSALTWNIGYLMVGRWVEWSVSEAADICAVVDEILHCFEDVAIPWLDRFKTSDDVRRELSQNHPRGFVNLKRTARRQPAG